MYQTVYRRRGILFSVLRTQKEEVHRNMNEKTFQQNHQDSFQNATKNKKYIEQSKQKTFNHKTNQHKMVSKATVKLGSIFASLNYP